MSQTISELNHSLMPHRPHWPTEKMVRNGTSQVETVCRSLGRQDTRFLWENCKFVEDRKSKLKLQKCISSLVGRAVAIDERPLHKFLEAASRQDSHSELAKELISILPKLEGRLLDVTKVAWIKFQPLFLQLGSPAVETNFKNAAASQEYQCYTKCLEILLDDLKWRRRHAEGSRRMLSWVAHSFPKTHLFFEKMQRFAVFPGSPEYVLPSTVDYMLEHKNNMRRAHARSRKRAERSRKAGKTA